MSPEPTATRAAWPAARKRLAAGLVVLLGGAGLASLAGLLARLWWPLELFSHFRVQYLFTCGLLGVGLAVMGRFRLALLATALVGLNLVWVAPGLLATRPEPGQAQLRLMMFNLQSHNREHNRVLEFIRAEDPDVLVLLEVNERWQAALEPLADAYPHRIVRPRADNFGIGLWTRLPVEQLGFERLGSNLPTAVARLRHPAGRLLLVGTHPPPPAGASLAQERDRQNRAVARLLSTEASERVLLGDLNLTAWSPFFDDLLSASGLTDSRRGFGLQTTWPTWFWPLSIPIDHCLVSPGLRVVDRRVGPHVGSDHRPIVVDLRFAQGGAHPQDPWSLK